MSLLLRRMAAMTAAREALGFVFAALGRLQVVQFLCGCLFGGGLIYAGDRHLPVTHAYAASLLVPLLAWLLICEVATRWVGAVRARRSR